MRGRAAPALWHPARPDAASGPLRERDFALLFGGTLISLLGDGIYLVALPFAVLAIADDPATLSLVGLAWSVGMLGVPARRRACSATAATSAGS